MKITYRRSKEMNKEKSSAGVFGKVVSLVLSLMLIISMAAFPALAASSDDSLFSYFDNGDGTIEISGYIGDIDTLTDLVIPSEIDGKAVTTIGYEAFSDCTSLKSVTISESVKSIYRYAFSNCTSLKSVTIPESVKSIGADAFGYFYNEEDELVKIGGFKITGYKNSAAYAYAHKNGFEFESLGEISPFAYNERKDGTIEISGYNGDIDTLTELAIPSEIDGKTVTIIGANVFSKYTSLESVTIPEGVKSIGDFAFSDCTSLKSVTIPEGVEFIGVLAFHNCTSLKSVMIPKSVISIFDGAFGYCFNEADNVAKVDGFKITGYKYSAAYAYARDDGFEFESLGEVSPFVYNELEDGTLEIIRYFGDDSDLAIPSEIDGKTVTIIGEDAFSRCISLENVMIPESVTHIYDGAFSSCTRLKSVTIPESVTEIGVSAFASCISLKSITIPESVKSISGYAFYRCISLENVTIPDGVTEIGYDAFYDCKTLKSVTIPKSVTYIHEYAFGFCQNEEGYTFKVAGFKIMGYAGTEAEAYANDNGFEFVDLGEVSPELDPDVSPFAYNELEDGTLEIIGYSGDESDLVIPAEINGKKVTAIASEAFQFCDNLQSVTIPYGVTTIGEDAFYGCLFLESVTIPESVTSIGNSAFFDCWIKSVTIPKSVTSIGDRAFGFMIDDTFDEIKGIDGFKIMGYAGTAAEAYANDNGFEFVDLDNAPTEPTDEPATDTTDATEPTDEPATDTTDATEPTDEPATDTTDAADATEQTDASDTAAPGGNNNAGGNGGSTGKVATGDSMSVVMLMVLLVLSAAATAVCVSQKRRNG